jgi:hypothetical protein
MMADYIESKTPNNAIVVNVRNDYIVDSANFQSANLTSNCREYSQTSSNWSSSCDLEAS